MDVQLQSIGGYSGSALNVTVLQYWILFLCSKILVYFFIGLVFFYFALASTSVVLLYIRSVLLFAVSFVLYWAINGNSSLQLLKYMNIINFVQVTPIYQYYFNLNIFSRPVNIVSVFFISCTLFCIVVFSLSLNIFSSRDSVLTLKSHSFFRKKQKERCRTSLLYHEAYKLLAIQKAFWILLLFICLPHSNDCRFLSLFFNGIFYRHDSYHLLLQIRKIEYCKNKAAGCFSIVYGCFCDWIYTGFYRGIPALRPPLQKCRIDGCSRSFKLSCSSKTLAIPCVAIYISVYRVSVYFAFYFYGFDFYKRHWNNASDFKHCTGRSSIFTHSRTALD